MSQTNQVSFLLRAVCISLSRNGVSREKLSGITPLIYWKFSSINTQKYAVIVIGYIILPGKMLRIAHHFFFQIFDLVQQFLPDHFFAVISEDMKMRPAQRQKPG